MATLRILIVDDDLRRIRHLNSVVRGINAKLGEEHLIILDDAMTAAAGIRALQGLGSPYTEGTGDAMYDACTLDHDMMPEHYVELSVGKPGDGTGRDVSRWLAENVALCPKHVNVHSWNPEGAKQMALDVFQASDGNVKVSIEKFPGTTWLKRAMEASGIPTAGIL